MPLSSFQVYVVTAASNGDTITLNNVLFGDVWVCSGQSNMQFTVDSAFNATEEVILNIGSCIIRI